MAKNQLDGMALLDFLASVGVVVGGGNVAATRLWEEECTDGDGDGDGAVGV
jgi:hypothetical protein